MLDIVILTGDAIQDGDKGSLEGGDHVVELVLLSEKVQGLVLLASVGQLDDLADITSSAESLLSCALDDNDLAQIRSIPSLCFSVFFCVLCPFQSLVWRIGRNEVRGVG